MTRYTGRLETVDRHAER